MSAEIITSLVKHLKQEVYRKDVLDVGKGASEILGVSQVKFNSALAILREEGYSIHAVIVGQNGSEDKTIIKTLSAPSTLYRTIAENPELIKQVDAPEVDTPKDESISVIFGPDNPNFVNQFEYNMMFLHQSENHMNTMLQRRGHVFLNEIFDQLGMKRTVEGQKKGWLYNGPKGQSFIDFGLPQNMTALVSSDGSITLTFNVDGEIIEDI